MGMEIKGKTIFFVILGFLGVWFLYDQRAIFTPFIVGGVFAYLLNPIVNFCVKKLKIHRTVAILCIYLLLIALVVLGGIILSSRIIEETADLRVFLNHFLSTSQGQVKTLPDWLQPTARDFLMTIKRSRFLALISGQSMFPLFSQAISRVISFFIFLFSTFYFLKDGEKLSQYVVSFIPSSHKKNIDELVQKVHEILGGYLRGQMLLVVLMTIATYIPLSLLGIRFAFLIALFSGFAETVPVVGPIVAGSVAVLVALITGVAHFGLSPVQTGVAIAAIYFVLRQLEDYFVMPYVYSRVTQLPAFIIFFAVVAGGHIAGILGLILAVPVAAIIRLFMTYFLQKYSQKA